MIRHTPSILALTMALAGAADSPLVNPLDTIREGTYSQPVSVGAGANILNWNIDRGQRFERIVTAIRETNPGLCIFQEVDFAARRRRGKQRPRLPESGLMSESQDARRSDRPSSENRLAVICGAGCGALAQLLKLGSESIIHAECFGELLRDILAVRAVAIYNLHLENRGSEHGRLIPLEEVLADAQRYAATMPVMVAGDLNTKSRHSPLIARMREAGYRSCFVDRRLRTHIIIGALDWIFVRGPVECSEAEVRRDFHGSDHFAISARLKF